MIGADADEVACVDTPLGFFAIGEYYASFPRVSDDEVMGCLTRAAKAQDAEHAAAPGHQ